MFLKNLNQSVCLPQADCDVAPPKAEKGESKKEFPTKAFHFHSNVYFSLLSVNYSCQCTYIRKLSIIIVANCKTSINFDLIDCVLFFAKKILRHFS